MKPFDVIPHILLLLVFPPLMLGVINRTKAFFGGRRGQPLFQAYYDIIKLMRKELVLSTTTTWIFVASPVVGVVTVFFAGLIVPVGPFNAPLSFSGDVLLFAYLLALGRFFMTSAALDTGSAFAGMGSARDVTFACIAEPALFCGLLALVRISGVTNMNGMLHTPAAIAWNGIAAPLVLVAIGLFIVLLAESCRIPVDDPNTHLELTMIHEAMVLDHSGPLMGMILYGASLKLYLLCTLLLHVIMPFQAGTACDWFLFMAGMIGIAILIGSIESIMARLQMRRVPYLLVAAVLCCGFGFILLAR